MADRESSSSLPKNRLRLRIKHVTLIVGLVLLVWAFSALFPRAWNAGQVLLGLVENPNDIVRDSNHDPDLDAPDIAPGRVEVVRQHQQVMEEMAQAYYQLAQDYAGMRNPRFFEASKNDVERASLRLEQAAARGASLPKLEPAEKTALSYLVNYRLKGGVATAAQEVNKLTQTPGIEGDFDTLLAALKQAMKQFDQEYTADSIRPAVLLVMNKLQDATQIKIIEEKARVLTDDPSSISCGWRTEGETSQLKLQTVFSARDYADRIKFGKVRHVRGRRIEIDVVPPSAEEIARYTARTSASESAPAASVASAPPAQPAAPSAPTNGPATNVHPEAEQRPDGTPVSSPSIVGFRWMDEASDFVGGIKEGVDPGHADGTKDQHFSAELELPPKSFIEEMTISSGDAHRWVTQPSQRYWPITIHQGANVITNSHSSRVGEFSGRQTFDLFCNTDMGIGPGTPFDLQVVVSINGTRHTLSSQCKRP